MTKTVLITGASQGLGYEFSKLFAKKKYSLVLVSRNGEELLKVKSELEKDFEVSVVTIAADLSLPYASEQLYEKIIAHHMDIDVLVNNAGFATHGKFVDISLSDEISEIELNITALTSLTKLFAKDMVRKGNGRILNIASTAAFQPGPLMAVYYATKAYVLSFSEALSQELTGTGVTVTVLCPGATRTGFAKRADVEHTLMFRKAADPAIVAQQGYDGLMSGRRVVVSGFMNKLGSLMVNVIPRSILLPIIMKMQK